MVVFFSQNICHMIECLHKCKHFTRWKIWKHSIFFSVSHETDAWFMNFLYNLLFSKNLKKYFYTVDFENKYLKIKIVVVSKQYSIIHIYARILMLSTTSAACFACVRSLDIGFHFSVILITIVMFFKVVFLGYSESRCSSHLFFMQGL